MNQTVEQVLRTALNSQLLATWEDKLPIVEMSINNASLFHSEFSPFYLNYGYHPRLFEMFMNAIEGQQWKVWKNL